MSTQVKAVIFDCFGVLIGDGLELLCQDIEKTDPGCREEISELVHLTNRGLMDTDEFLRRLSERLGMEPTECRAVITRGEVRNNAVLELVRSLRPRYQTALLSNIGRGSLAKRFTDAELSDLFDLVVPSSEVGMLKPDPAIYRYTADKLDVNPKECVFIDDRESYVDAAKQVGMHGVWFRSATQTQLALNELLGDPKN